MSLRVQHLTKLYNDQIAVDDISFEVGENEIVGFLGPNGAGKSTTMKVMTGYIPPTSGLVDVGGFDVGASPLKVKKIIGYLPENNPLYLDMYVHEYLAFAGGLYGLRGDKLKGRIAEMIERCGLTREQNKKIETLSKGYRQRVGLAQALIHDPKVLILDEPTSGLDPNQLVEIRSLIKDISLNKTVIFSTHIMQEVQALCDRVIMINRGRLVADEPLNELLKKRGAGNAVIVEFSTDVSIDELKLIDDVAAVSETGARTFRLVPMGEVDLRPAIFRFASSRNLSLVGLRQEENSLEAVFQQLTS
jgi:ABC-2 type transport system ATP-binding protein